MNIRIRIVLFHLLIVFGVSPSPVVGAESACAGNLVWVDANGDGIKNNSEKGYRGADVVLNDSDGQEIDRVQSSNGYFRLCGAGGGQHQLKIEIPSGFKISPQWQGNSIYHDSDADQFGYANVDLKTGRFIGKYDIGLVPIAIAGTVTDDIEPQPDETAEIQQPVIPTPTNSDSGVLFGPWVESRYRTDGVFGTFTGALTTVTTNNVIDVLDDARLYGTSLFIQLGSTAEWGWNFSTGKSNFTLQKWKRSVSGFGSSGKLKNAIELAINDGTIRGFYLIDEPHHKRWSPTGAQNHITNRDIDEMARLVKSYWPNATTAVRASPRTLTFYGRDRHQWRYLDEAFLMINYRKWASNGKTGLEGFMEREITEANRQGLKLIGSIQMLIGAPTSSEVFWPDIRRGGARPVGKLRVSPLELQLYVDTFLKRRNANGKLDPDGVVPIDAIMVFRWDRNAETDWQDDYYHSAITEISGALRLR